MYIIKTTIIGIYEDSIFEDGLMGSVVHESIWIHIIEIFYEFLVYIIYYVYIISL